mmetsp:Transcript_47618/g.95305  ORF Transcript_47618/g.95305 Transcript_47618/m.95305 type:complete len:220 (-) Transcript_47618:40-699(-)
MVWNACSTFVAAFADVSKYGMFPLLCPANRQYFETVGGRLRTYLAPGKRALLGHHALVEVDLVAKNHKREVVRVARSGLDQEFISPAVQVFKRLDNVNIENQNAAVRSTVECHAQALKSLLSCCIPRLHGHKPVVHIHLLGQEIGSDRCLVLIAELLVDILVHQRRFANPGVTKDDHFQQSLFATGHFGKASEKNQERKKRLDACHRRSDVGKRTAQRS